MLTRLAALLALLALSVSASAQSPPASQSFPNYILGKPTASPPGTGDSLPLIQGGATKRLPAIATPSRPGLVYPDGTTITIDPAGKITSVGGGPGPGPSPGTSNCILISGTTTNCLLVSGTTTNALLVK